MVPKKRERVVSELGFQLSETAPTAGSYYLMKIKFREGVPKPKNHFKAFVYKFLLR